MEYRSAIVDECGEVMYWCSELEDYENGNGSLYLVIEMEE